MNRQDHTALMTGEEVIAVAGTRQGQKGTVTGMRDKPAREVLVHWNRPRDRKLTGEEWNSRKSSESWYPAGDLEVTSWDQPSEF